MMKQSVLAATAVMMAFAPGVILGARIGNEGDHALCDALHFPTGGEPRRTPPWYQRLYWRPWEPRRT